MHEVKKSLDGRALSRLVSRQLNFLFPDGNTIKNDDIHTLLPKVFERLDHCFSRINNKYFFDGQQTIFNHLHGDQYAMFLYWLSREAYLQNAGESTASKIFLLNKSLHGIDAFYEVILPDIFLLVHPLSTVLGRAKYDDYLLVYQRCSVGSNHDVYPVLEDGVTLRPGSSVLGRCTIGRGSTLASESMIIDKDLPPGTIYMGLPGFTKHKSAQGKLPIWRTFSNGN